MLCSAILSEETGTLADDAFDFWYTPPGVKSAAQEENTIGVIASAIVLWKFFINILFFNLFV